jgi:hypothetical protein
LAGGVDAHAYVTLSTGWQVVPAETPPRPVQLNWAAMAQHVPSAKQHAPVEAPHGVLPVGHARPEVHVPMPTPWQAAWVTV